MILHAQQGFRGEVWDLDTGLKVPGVISLDTERGELEAYRMNGDGKVVRDVNGDLITYRARGRFKYVPRNAPAEASRPNGTSKIKLGAPQCVKCKTVLTLPGHDLCPFCNALDRGYKGFKIERLTTPFLDKPCEKRCGRLATWQVSDEVTVTPELGVSESYRSKLGTNRIWFERGATVGRHFYCAFCYQPPRLLDPKGEVVEEFAEAGGVRPN